METSENTGTRAVWYIVGLNLIAATVVLNIRYNIGVAAFSSVMYAISEIYRISLGTASIICYLIFVMMQCILSRRITLIYLLEIPLSFAFGVLTDVYDWLIPALPFALPTRLLCFTLTMFVTSAGVFLCVKSKMVLTPTPFPRYFICGFPRSRTRLTFLWLRSAPCCVSSITARFTALAWEPCCPL